MFVLCSGKRVIFVTGRAGNLHKERQKKPPKLTQTQQTQILCWEYLLCSGYKHSCEQLQDPICGLSFFSFTPSFPSLHFNMVYVFSFPF